MTAPLLIGSGAGFSGDRTDAALPVVRTLIAAGGPGALIFETLAERTLALAQLARRDNPEHGYEPLLDLLLTPVLGLCLTHGIPIIGNFGAANPRAAARRVLALAAELGLPAPRVAVVEGDDLSHDAGRAMLRRIVGESFPETRFVCANAYIGARAIADALREGAQVVVCGRVADPALAVGPAMAHFDWAWDDWNRLAAATMAGHLLECGAQVSGGYFADPGMKDVPDVHAVGFPIAQIDADGGIEIFKAANTGGCVDLRTVKEQLLYEVHDPSAYLTPDVVADIGAVTVEQIGTDRVAVRNIRGHARPAELKANLFHQGGWFAEGEISYAGPNAAARARLAADIVRKRMQGLGHDVPIRCDLIGVLSVFADDSGAMISAPQPHEADARDVRMRVALAHEDKAVAQALLREVNALYTCGPAGGGGVRTGLRARLNATSCLVPRDAVTATHAFVA
ncbi:acyclic terpene utilization AtuA family protein [Cupriavidus sp. SW-Y-13]|uniref:acyclic terpene utilization AtuA family protein n=1 Tax=Cupriavidus sp. SW-Y-13 TaxID=2653854 RepID=UPI001365F04F|nr:acyclic terpene utilization AtuA family protein [Cupriavidus sp. SW-Y-13]MWL90746.1 acyclic terpene utilization AtuA family protein [Cupriavidus sp. SW-Y-13]